MRDPHDMSREQLADLVSELQLHLYLERDPKQGFVWNPNKDVSCGDVAEFLQELMGRNRLHPSSVPIKKPFVHRPEGIEYEMSGPGEGTWIRGNRLEASVAPSKKLADIVDGKTFRKLILLDVEALKELRDLSQELIDFMGG
jgi:hypothetical protein